MQIEVVSKYQYYVHSVRDHHRQSQQAKQSKQSFQEKASRHGMSLDDAAAAFVIGCQGAKQHAKADVACP